jgi:hypothetical protein
MALTVNFRVVGVFCYLPNLSFPQLTPQSTVKEVMDAIAAQNPDFTYDAGGTPLKVDRIQYRFGASSVTPPNSKLASPGTRDIETSLSSTALVLQYYRSVSGLIGGVPVELVVPTVGQPSFAVTALDQGFAAPPSFQPVAYNLTWRLVQIQISDETRTKFLTAKLDARNKRSKK